MKVSFNKLGLKLKQDYISINANGQDIEVLQYLPVEEKLKLLGDALGFILEDKNYKSPLRQKVALELNIVYYYTNITFTEKQKNDFVKIYDILFSSGALGLIIDTIPEAEYKMLKEAMSEVVDSYYEFKTSAVGVIDAIVNDYSEFKIDTDALQRDLANPENIKLLKDVVTKLG